MVSATTHRRDLADVDRTCLDRGSHATALPLTLWAVVVGSGAVLVYLMLVAPGAKRLDGVPLHATFDPYLGLRTVIPVTILAGTVACSRRLRALAWPRLLLTWWMIAAVWAVALAVARHPRRLASPFEHRGEYLAAVPQIGSVGTFLETFVARISSYPVHVEGHPPGFVLVAWALDGLGAGGPVMLAAVVVTVGTAAVPLVLIAVRDVVDEQWARAVAPFLAVGPAAIWIATTADAFFTGVGAGAVALVVMATSCRGPRRVSFAAIGGVLFGACVMLSYGLVLLAVVPLGVAVTRRALDVVGIATLGGAVVIGGFAVAGFWWLDGLIATRQRYLAGIASERPYALFLLVNLSILLLALGPAVAVALWRLRRRDGWLLVGGALVALALADTSGMSKSEVERIWLPFMPYVVVSAGAFTQDRCDASTRTLDSASRWLLVQGVAAIALESVVRTAW